MKFGIFYEHQLPRPWTADSERTLIQNSLDQIELADKLGYDYAWEVEHHFLEEYSHSSAPEVFLAAASQRTKNIRLGHGIVQLTTNHPARVAERVSTLDLVSNGRVELGLGEGASVTELHPFDRRFRDKRVVWEEAVQATLPMFWNHGWEWDGHYFKFPLRNVVPSRVQKPHPPLWVACSQLDTIVYAGHRGMGALCFKFVDLAAAQAWVNAYYNTFVHNQQKLTDYQTNPNIAVVARLHVLRHRRRSAAALRRLDLLPVHAADLQRRRSVQARRDELLGALSGVEEDAEGPAPHRERADRIAGDHPPAPARAREGERRPGDPAQPGRQEHAPGHLLEPGDVRARGDARVPRPRGGAPAVEARRPRRREKLEIIDTEAYSMAGRLRPTQPPSEEAQRVKDQIEARIARHDSAAAGS